jgi:hypothetical protein
MNELLTQNNIFEYTNKVQVIANYLLTVSNYNFQTSIQYSDY